jgi:hypothetical protein
MEGGNSVDLAEALDESFTLLYKQTTLAAGTLTIVATEARFTLIEIG